MASLGQRGTSPPIEDELALIARAQAGDLAARNALIEHHLPYIRSRVKASRFRNRRHDPAEYMGSATIAFIRAVMKYDPARKCRLTTYASHAINRQLQREAFDDHIIRAPEGSRNKTKDWDKNYAQARRVVSLENLRRDEDDRNYEPAARDDNGHSRIAQDAGAFLRGLNSAERDIVTEHLLGDATLEQIGAAMGICKERVRQIEAGAINHMRRAAGLPPRTKRATPWRTPKPDPVQCQAGDPA